MRSFNAGGTAHKAALRVCGSVGTRQRRGLHEIPFVVIEVCKTLLRNSNMEPGQIRSQIRISGMNSSHDPLMLFIRRLQIAAKRQRTATIPSHGTTQLQMQLL